MWRIAQEALVNVERHANATAVSCVALSRSRCLARGRRRRQGPPTKVRGRTVGRSDSYGIVGMRERADSVGATLELTSEPGEGTRSTVFPSPEVKTATGGEPQSGRRPTAWISEAPPSLGTQTPEFTDERRIG